jgi:predicted Fe-Mo cluster-binding NifX family protein
MKCCNSKWGGKREAAGRKKTCLRKVPFNRRINENILNILKDYAKRHNMTDTEALESAILLQSNIENKIMKICIPTTSDGKLCGHFGHCDSFMFAEIDPETKRIISVEKKVPEEGISCQSASWISEQGVSKVLAGGMGGRPMMIFAQNGVEVVTGCPELLVLDVIRNYLSNTLETGENACGGEGHNHSHCHHHGEGHHCHH